MAQEPDNLVLVILREIRAKLDEHSRRFDSVDQRFDRIDLQLADIHKQLRDQSDVVIHSLGQSTETRFRQTQKSARLDDLFDRVEKLFKEPQPT